MLRELGDAVDELRRPRRRTPPRPPRAWPSVSSTVSCSSAAAIGGAVEPEAGADPRRTERVGDERLARVAQLLAMGRSAQRRPAGSGRRRTRVMALDLGDQLIDPRRGELPAVGPSSVRLDISWMVSPRLTPAPRAVPRGPHIERRWRARRARAAVSRPRMRAEDAADSLELARTGLRAEFQRAAATDLDGHETHLRRTARRAREGEQIAARRQRAGPRRRGPGPIAERGPERRGPSRSRPDGGRRPTRANAASSPPRSDAASGRSAR